MIAAVTMVRNDNFFLEKWVDYYSKQFGRENLYIFFDGLDQTVPSFCHGTNAVAVEKIGQTVKQNDRLRLDFLSEKAAELFKAGYDIVVGGDADEYLAVDPDVSPSLADFLSNIKHRKTVSGLGIDVGQKLGKEKPLTLRLPFLSQRRFGRVSTRYTKASVMFRPLKWGSGFHRVRGTNFHIPDGLYMFHFGFSDNDMIKAKLLDADRIKSGWEKHLKKRSLTIRLVTERTSVPLDRVARICRKGQTLFRPPYAWNKPALLGLRVIVEIPARFHNLL